MPGGERDEMVGGGGGGGWWVGIVWYNKTNMKSQHGQQGIPGAHILHCPSEFCKFQQAALRKWGRRIS